MQNEVIEKKEKKPLSKKRIAAIVALSLVAVLILVPVVNQCMIALFDGEFYEQDGLLQNSRVYVENVYVQDGVLHFTVVNDTIEDLPYIPISSIKENVSGEWVECEREGLSVLGNKGQAAPVPKDYALPVVPAFGKVELTRELADYKIDEGTYRFTGIELYPEPSFITHALGYLIPINDVAHFSAVGTFEIPAAS